MAKQRRTTGRVTPKGTTPNEKRSPAARPGSDPTPSPQVGRRPSNPALLVAIAVAWIIVGVVILVTFDAGWRFVPGIVAIGIGLLFLRGAAATVVRRDQRQ